MYSFLSETDDSELSTSKQVGSAFLDSGSEDEEEGKKNKQITKKGDGFAKSMVVGHAQRIMSSLNEQNTKQGRYQSEFQHIARLGRGGFGSVDLVRNKLDRGLYAVKKIRFRRRRKDGKLGKKLTREILAMNELSHPNIVRYHGSWTEDDPTPHGTPNSSRERGEKLFEFNDEDDEDEDDDEYGEDDEGTQVVNADDDDEEDDDGADDEDEDDDDVQFGRLEGEDLSGTNEGSISGASPFEMDEDEKKPSRGRKKKRSNPSSDSWAYGTLYIQMQYYEETLDAWLDNSARKNHVCCHVSRDIFMQIVEALHYIHSKGYIHRDLKPANIFLTPRKEEGPPVSGDECKCEVCGSKGCGRGYIVSIGDFGLTTFSQDRKATVESEENSPVDDKSLRTSSDLIPSGTIPVPVTVPNNNSEGQPFAASMGSIFGSRFGDDSYLRSRSRSNSRNSSLGSRHTTGVGSTSYASPEQKNGQFYDEKTDVFSLGIICYQLFSQPFFTRMERANEFEKLRAGRIPDAFRSAHPKEAELILSCVSVDPTKRPSTTDILAMDIWEPAPCMCLRDSSYAITIPRSMFKHMQDEIARLQQELASAKEQLAKASNGNQPLILTPRRRNNGILFRSAKQPLTRNDDLPKLF